MNKRSFLRSAIAAGVTAALSAKALAQAKPAAAPAAAMTPVPAGNGITADAIKLGQSAPLSGAAKSLGVDMRDGALAYFEWLNKNGGINGRSVQLVTLDDQYEPDKAKVNTEKLINTEKVFALFGYVGTPTSNASRPIFEAAKVAFVAPFTGAEALRNPVSPLIFNLRASYFDETELIVQHLLSFGLQKVAVFYQNDAYGLAGLAGVKKALDARKLPIAVQSTVERNTIDVAKAVSEISAVAPDAVIMISAYTSCAQFIKEFKKTSVITQFFNVSFVGTGSLATALGDDAYGTVISQVVPVPSDRTIPVVAEFQQRMKEFKPKSEVSFTSLEGFMAAKMMAEGLRRAGKDLTTEGLIKAMETIQQLDLGGFLISFSDKSHSGSRYVDLTMIGKKKQIVH